MRKHLRSLIIICIALIIIIFLVIIKYGMCSLDNSKIFEFMSEYQENKTDFTAIKGELKENSSEYFFMLGLEELENSNIIQAKSYFKNAENNSPTDSILKVYISYYQNKCSYFETGEGDYSAIEKFFENLSSCSLLRNNTDLIWDVTSTIIDTKESRKIAIKNLNTYLSKTKKLTLSSSLIIKGNIGMLNLINENYSETAYIFYSIIDEAEKISDTDTKNYFKIRAYEYLGDIYAMFGEYESAIEAYNDAIALPISDLEKNAKAKYSAYVNRTANYISVGNITKAKKDTSESLKIIEHLPDDLKEGVKIFRYNNLALIEIRNENFTKAEEYLNICYSLLKKDKNNVFLNNDLYVELTSVELNIKQNKLKKALKLAEDILQKDNTSNLSFKAYVYPYMLKIYYKMGKTELCVEINKKLKLEENTLNQSIKHDYIKYMNSNYKAQKLAQKNKQLFFSILIVVFCCVFITCIAIVLVFHNRKIKQGSQLDELTQVYNRKYLEHDVKKMLLKNSTNINIGVLMIDIDYFKLYNDLYGHPMGDTVIKQVADCLKSSIRNKDIIIRYGGEEFLVLLRNIDSNILDNICDRIKLEVETQKIPHAASKASEFVTLSIGGTIGVINNYNELLDKIKLADSCLYKSKENGRNQYTIEF